MQLRYGVAAFALAAGCFAGSAFAQPIKIAYIDPLSGAFANVGEAGAAQFQAVIDDINAKGGVLNGRKFELVKFDNKTSPQESLIQFNAVTDQGIRYITQGNGSSVAGVLIDAGQQVERAQPRQDRAVSQLCRGRSRFHQRQVQLLAFPLRRQQRHENAGADRLHRQEAVDQESLFVQPGLPVRQAGLESGQRHAGQEAARHQDRRRRVHSAGQGQGLRALRGQDQGRGRRHHHHRQLGQRLVVVRQGGARSRAEVRLLHVLRRAGWARRRRWARLRKARSSRSPNGT